MALFSRGHQSKIVFFPLITSLKLGCVVEECLREGICTLPKVTQYPDTFADLVKRHAGVLGLSACILSSPYDVPTWMPQLLMDLSAHLNDPQPIEVKIHNFCD